MQDISYNRWQYILRDILLVSQLKYDNYQYYLKISAQTQSYFLFVCFFETGFPYVALAVLE